MNTPILSASQQSALRQKYNPDGSQLRQHQLELLDMLKTLAAICSEHDIRWWLSSGTLLGAMRHQGFVPWDDDVDIVMFKEDYKKLYKVLRHMQSDTYVLHSMQTDIEYTRCFSKFRKREGKEYSRDRRRHWYRWTGNYIDIFVIEKTSYAASILSGTIYKNLIYLTAYIQTGWLRRLLIRPIKFLCLDILNPLLRLVGLINPHGEYHYILGMGWPWATFYKKDILPLTTASFEGVEFPVPKDADAYLSGVYGDWRQLPTDETIKKNIHRMEYISEIFEK